MVSGQADLPFQLGLAVVWLCLYDLSSLLYGKGVVFAGASGVSVLPKLNGSSGLNFPVCKACLLLGRQAFFMS